MSQQVTTWDVLRQYGPAGAFHQHVPPPGIGHEVWIRTIPRPALVLGSTQPDQLINHGKANAAGIEVCRRRSGGGVVWINPDTDVWVDVIVPANSPLWSPDIGRSFHWLGGVWADTLRDATGARATNDDSTPAIETALGAGSRSAAGKIWCFADIGHGEVTVDGAKVVGLSQRRTRNWARLQCLVLSAWPGAALSDYIDMNVAASLVPDTDPSSLTPAAVTAGFPAGLPAPDRHALTDTFLRLLTSS